MSTSNLSTSWNTAKIDLVYKQYQKNRDVFNTILAVIILTSIVISLAWIHLLHKTPLPVRILNSNRISNNLVEPRYKYMLSACVIARQASDIFPEFIVRNYAAGVDHFFIYGDDEDNPEEQERLHFLFSFLKGIVTYIPNGRMVPEDEENMDNYVQMRMYRHCLEKNSHTTKWIAFIDTDEFFETYALPVMEKNHRVSHKKAFLHDVLRWNEGLPVLCVRWRSALTNGHLLPAKPGKYLHDQFPETCRISSVNNGKLAYKKSIVQTRFVDLESTPKRDISLHSGFRFKGPRANTNFTCHFELGKNLEPPIHLVHYWSRDLSSYLLKIQRGRPRKGIPSRSLEDLFRREELCIPDESLSSSHIRKEYIHKVLSYLPKFTPNYNQIANISFSLQSLQKETSNQTDNTISFCKEHVFNLLRHLANGHDFLDHAYCTGRSSPACLHFTKGSPSRWPFPWFEYISSCDEVLPEEDLFERPT